MNSIIIKNGRLIDPQAGCDAVKDIWLEGGQVKAVDNPGAFDGHDGEVIDAAGHWVTPGLIDIHVHLREPGQEFKETVLTGTRSAAAGGFTAVVSMPNTDPAIDHADHVRAVLDLARAAGYSRVWPAAAMTKGRKGAEMTEYEDLKSAGAVAVTDDGSWLANPKVLRRVLDYSTVAGLKALSHAEDHQLSKGGAMNESRVSTRLGLPGIPSQAETNAVQRDINMVELTGKPLHFCHLSTKGAVDLVRAAKKKGLPVTCETAPHYLHLTDEALVNYDPNFKMNPPLREAADREALRQGLADGTIDAVATDHAPHSILEKEVEFVDAAFGIIGLETSLPLIMALVDQGIITPAQLVSLMSQNPARIINIPGGNLLPGAPADVTIIDPECRFTFTREENHSHSYNSPFFGWEMKGRAVATIVGGRKVYSLKK